MREALKCWGGRFLRNIWGVMRSAGAGDVEDRMALANMALCLPLGVRERYREELDWLSAEMLRSTPQTLFPYPVVRKPIVETDVECGFERGFPFVVHEGRRLYFAKGRFAHGGLAARMYADYLSNEGLLGGGARLKSPHCYETADHRPEANDVLLDIGCAEALYAFHWVPRVKKAYLFECEERWRKPLEMSFASCRDKATVVNKYVGAENSARCVRLQDAVSEREGECYFVKMDIEGAERAVIESSREFLQRNRVKISACCYHRQDDAEYLGALLEGMGFSVSFSEGYMLPTIGGVRFPFFRKGVVYARNY